MVPVQKCDVCGSTAIDHTETDCRFNRLSRAKKKKSPSSKVASREQHGK